MLLMSATLNSPELFAGWLEEITIKQVMLCITEHRSVPLYHYMWLNSTKNIMKQDNKFINNCNTFCDKLVPIKTNNNIYTDNLYKIRDIKTYCKKHNLYVNKVFAINELVNYLKNNKLLPAICFIYSRKKVEFYANKINYCLHLDSTKINTVKSKCHSIISKIPNYKEYIILPEYLTIISLLEKGIAYHHSGMLPVFREMVELMFQDGYVQLLFATETFAIGINMPTKTVIFTQMSKYTHSGFRLLYSHEYTQQAGRAGRRGFDTKGIVD